MKQIFLNLLWALFLFLSGLAVKFYWDYQNAVDKAIKIQQQLDSLRLENTIIHVRDTVFVPDTVYQVYTVEKIVKQIVRDTVLTPLILTDTIYIEKKTPYFKSFYFYEDKYLNARIWAFAKTPVDSFRFGYDLKVGAIVKEAGIKINLNRPAKTPWWLWLEHGLVIGMGTYFIMQQMGR